MKKILFLFAFLLTIVGVKAQPVPPEHSVARQSLWQSFVTPPDSIRVGCYYYWVNELVDTKGVVADLQWMKDNGITLAFLATDIRNRTRWEKPWEGEMFGKNKFQSRLWWKNLRTALKTAGELGIEMGLFNCPGWSQSGGPWVKPEEAMRNWTPQGIEVCKTKQGTDVACGPCSDEAEGLEVDKLSKVHVKKHFESFIGEILRRIPPQDRPTLTTVVVDSWERGKQNYTDSIFQKFQQRFGRPLDYEDEACRKDLERLISDLVATEYMGGLTEKAHEYGLRTWCEPYAHSPFPGNSISYGSQADEVAAEFWVNDRKYRQKEVDAALGAARKSGKNRVWAESFTDGSWDKVAQDDWSFEKLKPIADRYFHAGINATILHVMVSQPGDPSEPAVRPWFGTFFDRRSQHAADLKPLVSYLRRCNFMLQLGKPYQNATDQRILDDGTIIRFTDDSQFQITFPDGRRETWDPLTLKSEAPTARKFTLNLTPDGKASLTCYLPQQPSGRAVVGCPGGGYRNLSMQNEGHDWAQFFNEQGIAYFVLTYRMPGGNRDIPLGDARKAMRTVRDSAQAWAVNPLDVGIMGFSAGGHLASTISTHTELAERPDFSILFYPVISMNERESHKGSCVNFLGEEGQKDARLVKEYSNQNAVRRHLTPPAILLTTNDDRTVPPATNAIAYYSAMRRMGNDCALYVYPTGGHGFGMNPKFKYHDQMLGDLRVWLKELKAPRQDAVRVACIGNSITDGHGIDMAPQRGYPALLQQFLGSGYVVKNLGVGARTLLNKGDHPYMQEQAWRDALAFRPDVAIIKLGTNDSKTENWQHGQEFEHDMQQMIDSLRASNAAMKIWLCTPIPAFKQTWTINDAVITNEIIPIINKVAQRNDCQVIDLHTQFAPYADMMQGDGIHPNEQGVRKIAELVRDVLQQ
ncbi:MAG: prolyl oligopeptidase family serine peptidase [Prevotella sp.]|nr:prolyl oligopeptidase family serine peptidase [Prevotella sp.]